MSDNRNETKGEGEVMESMSDMDERMRGKFQEEAPDLLPLAESFSGDPGERWYVSGVLDGSGWWGDGAGFVVDLTVTLPGAEGLDPVIWVGKDHALLDLRSGEYTEGAFRMTHETLREMLADLPKSWMAYEMEEASYAGEGDDD
jgi:hypothetical protein